MSEPTPTSHQSTDPARETPPTPGDRATPADQRSQSADQQAQPADQRTGAEQPAWPGPSADQGSHPAHQASQPAWGGLQPYAPGPPRTNSFAIASLVCSLAGLVTGISVIAGIVLGHIALNQIKQTGEEGRSFAIAGLAIGYGLLAVGFLIIVAAVFFIAVLGAYSTTVASTTAL